MNGLDKIPGGAGRVTVAGAPEGLDGRIIAQLAAKAPAGVLHIARDDARMAALARAIGFFAPGLDIVRLPAWDCLPYDRVSPNGEVTAQRMDALARLVDRTEAGTESPFVLLTTVNAAVQRLPARDLLRDAILRVAVGGALKVETLLDFMVRNGFSRTGTVMEAGEFATRGGIIDIYPPGAEAPLRLDFFGDTLESIRVFDPLTQRTIGNQRRIDLAPVSEVLLTDETITRFRGGYRALFGAVTDDDPLYASVSEGRKHIGMEHWLPLFHDKLDSVFDYMPDALMTQDHLVDEARDARLTQIHEHYDARVEAAESRSYGHAPIYKPVPPDRLYLPEAEWRTATADRRAAAFTPFQVPPGDDVIDAGGRHGRKFTTERAQDDVNVFDALRDHIVAHRKQARRVVVAGYSAGSADRLGLVLRDHNIDGVAPAADGPAIGKLADDAVALVVLPLEDGFETDDLTVIGEQDILGDRLVRTQRRNRRAEDFISEAAELATGDLVVHVEHGIGRYGGLLTIDVGGAPHDCLHVTYDGGDKLYVPVENIEVLSRYGSENLSVPLDRLGGAGWQARKSRLKQRIREIADELIKVAAARELKSAIKVLPPDGMYDEFCARFPYEETEDQRNAIGDVFDDLARGRPMDRLVCGDVGFGKTEIALRAAFAAVMTGGQVAVVTPTTLLSRQHHQTFSERFAGLPVKVGQLSRMVAAKEAGETKAGLADGTVDIVIGTHALLAKSVAFKNLTLLIVDEEQHFGVTHKERLKQMKANVHVLTLSATPIPRTLQLAMSGVKELSLIATPPVDRLAVRTFVLPFDDVVVREAILREHYRGGQSFYVCPRIGDLAEAEKFLRERIPEVKFLIAHGQMPPRQLEDVMGRFYDGGFDVLVSTTIIESGLDIPTANTLVVHRADMFGLAQLYQLRGRIGRSKLRAYAYFTLPARKTPTANAEKRLKVLQSLDTLGAGFSLASHDLDIRGAGNLLGEEQSGHVREVGLELYQQMLEEAVAAAKGGEAGDGEDVSWSPQINIGTAVLIPERYVTDLNVRLGLYRRLGHLEEQVEIDGFAAELIDRFGSLPTEVEHLLRIVAIKRLCRLANIEKLEAGPKGATLSFRNDSFADPAGLVGFINAQAGTAKLRPDHRLVYMRHWDEPEERLEGAHDLVRRLAKLVQSPAASSAA